ncbi:MAG: integrase core domain-containing protein [Planctomycetales bacterium]|nr:integrase core domain-containing protein [Planctomycetales bacterium]
MVHDRDTKFSAEFLDAMKAAGIQCKKLPGRSPDLYARAERVIQTIKHECLQHLIVLGRDHLDYLVKTFTAHFNTNRPHSHRNHRPPCEQVDVPKWTTIKLDDVEYREQLSGVIKSMHRKAA